ncbi:MAG: hypothetical protein AABY22_24005, partial [Nanoarchaeota archaeon]
MKINSQMTEQFKPNPSKMIDEKSITPEEEKIIEFSKRDDLMEYLVSRYAPSIYGNEEIKRAIILQLFGGVTIKTQLDK